MVECHKYKNDNSQAFFLQLSPLIYIYIYIYIYIFFFFFFFLVLVYNSEIV